VPKKKAAFSIADLVQDVDLKSIDILQLWARRSPGEPSEDIEPNWDVGIDNRTDNQGFRIRVLLDLELGNGEAGVELGLAYETTAISTTAIPIDAMEQFVNDVAMMAAVPYVRQSISDMTLRVFGTATTIPIMLRGQIKFELEPGEFHPDFADSDRP
jgi:hypothetical protein